MCGNKGDKIVSEYDQEIPQSQFLYRYCRKFSLQFKAGHHWSAREKPCPLTGSSMMAQH